MTVDQPSTRTTRRRVAADHTRLAAAARSILACPAEVELVVDGVDDVLGDGADLGMQDLGGVPTFSCPRGSAMAAAARGRRSALLTLSSGLGAPGSPDRTATLTLTGRLESRGLSRCECCEESREVVELVLNVVMLGRGEGPQVRVALDHFASPRHHLSRGYLQRSVEHANACHQQELRQAVSTTTSTRLTEVVGVTLSGLTADGVDLAWVDPDGAHATRLDFGRVARDPHELGELLRSTLHAGLC